MKLPKYKVNRFMIRRALQFNNQLDKIIKPKWKK